MKRKLLATRQSLASVQGPLTTDVFVPDMTDALTLISLIEQARQGTVAPSLVVGTYL